MSPPEWVESVFNQIAVPRAPGSPALREVQARLSRLLADMGFRVEHQGFAASSRQLTAVAVAGAGLVWSTLVLAPLFLLPVPGWSVSLFGAGTIGVVTMLALGVARGYLPVGTQQAEATNITATRGQPQVWLVAHADTKSQGLSLLGRILGAISAALGSAGLVILLAVRLATPLPWWMVVPVALMTLAGGVALSWSIPRNASPGAVDNATGVLAVLVAAHQLRASNNVGILITDAEEYGMQGARAFVRGRSRGGCFINFDGLDSHGRCRVMEHARRVSGTPRLSSGELAGALVRELGRRGLHTETKRLPFGVLVDGVILTAHGMQGVTLSRGDWRTLSVVHTARDSADRVDLDTAVETGEAAATAIANLLS